MKKPFDPRVVGQLLKTDKQLDQRVINKLRNAREQALTRYDERIAHPAFNLAAILPGFGTAHTHHRGLHYWGIAILLTIFLFSASVYWKNSVDHHRVSDLDIAILTDDLPLELYAY